MVCSLSGLAQPSDEIAFFLRAAFALQNVLAVAPEPFLDLGGIGEALRIGHRRQRLDALADAAATGLGGVGGKATGTAHGQANAARELSAIQGSTARGGQA